MDKKHKVKSTYWVEGREELSEWYFETLEACLGFAEFLKKTSVISIKIYDGSGDLVKHVNMQEESTYA
jgi:hypothetical protein